MLRPSNTDIMGRPETPQEAPMVDMFVQTIEKYRRKFSDLPLGGNAPEGRIMAFNVSRNITGAFVRLTVANCALRPQPRTESSLTFSFSDINNDYNRCLSNAHDLLDTFSEGYFSEQMFSRPEVVTPPTSSFWECIPDVLSIAATWASTATPRY